MSAPARAAAVRVLGRLREERATLAEILARERERLGDERDRALLAEIALGTERWRAALDHALAPLSSRPLDRVDSVVLDILRLSAYQLLYLDRLPANAVVDDGVRLTREAKKASASGFVNAILRKLAATRSALLPARPEPTDRQAALDYLSVTLSHPRWLVARWLDRYGFEAAERWTTFDNQPAPLTVRAVQGTNGPSSKSSRDELQSRLAAEGVETERTRYASHGLIVRSGRLQPTRAWREGLCIVQDEASQLVGELAASLSGPLALDACAAPGGKTLALTERLHQTRAGALLNGARALVVASDRRPRRMRLLRETLTRVGARQVVLVRLDVTRALPFADCFDLVLVDAPCSGLGTLRREADVRWRRTEQELSRLADTQLAMLEAAAGAVRPGGRLLYATCSSEPDENEDVAVRFLEGRGSFRALRPHSASLPAGVGSLINQAGHLRTSPHEHGLEAFFAAPFERVS